MNGVAERERLDRAIVRRGLAPSRSRAAVLVADGHVRVDGVPVRRAAQGVDPADVIEVDVTSDDVSRGAQKLRGALEALDALGGAPTAAGRTCLDAGASTGGFTQVLLERGAAAVVAVDVGHGQLVPRLGEDPRVTSIEGLNVRDLAPERLPDRVALVVGDMSFISLTLLLAPLLSVAAPGADLLLLVKPQFEVGRGRLGQGGVVTDPQARARAVQGVAEAAVRVGAHVVGVVPSPLAGTSGNRETFLWLRAPDVAGPSVASPVATPELLDAVGRAVAQDAPALVGVRGTA